MKKLAFLFVLALAPLVSCGGDDAGSVFGSAPTEEGLRTAVAGSYDAFKRGDFRAMWEGLSASCKDAYGSQSDFMGQMIVASGMVEGFYDIELKDTELGPVEVVEFTPDRAQVRTEVVDGDGTPVFDDDEVSAWVYEDGWKTDDCDDVRDDVGDDSGNGDDSGTGDESDDDSDATTTTEAKGPGASRSDPVPVGSETTLAFDGSTWRIAVTGAEEATAAVLDANQFNEAPPPGLVYVIVRYSVTLVSADEEPVHPASSLDITAVDSSNTEVDRCGDHSAYWSGGDDDYTETYAGGTLHLEECYALPAENLGSLLLAVEDFRSFDSRKTFFATS